MADEEKKDIQDNLDDTTTEATDTAAETTEETVTEVEAPATQAEVVVPVDGDDDEADSGEKRVDTEELKAIARSVPSPDAYPKGQGEEIEKRLGEDATAFDKGVAAVVKETEALSETAPVKAFGRAITSIQRGIESLSETPEGHDPHNTDTTVFRGKVYDIPLYTSVFLVLGVLTIIEVLVAEIFTADAITIPVNLSLAVTKAFLVVYYYMHLNTDSRVFRWTLLVPVGVGLLSALFLMAIPTGY